MSFLRKLYGTVLIKGTVLVVIRFLAFFYIVIRIRYGIVNNV